MAVRATIVRRDSRRRLCVHADRWGLDAAGLSQGPSNTEAGDQFGVAVALAGDTLAVGALARGQRSEGHQS